jgi:regulator of sigma E protease
MVLTVVSFFVVLSILVFVHELGHYAAAKWRNVRVEEFGMGYPPRIAGVRLGETLYSINAIPFGGFTKMTGEDDPTDPRGLAAQNKRTRLLILASGPIMNLLLAVFCFVLSFGLTSAVGDGVRISGVAPDSPAQSAGLRGGDVVLSADATAVNTPDELIAYTKPRADQPITLRLRRAGEILEIPVTPRFNAESNKGEMGLYLSPRMTWGQAIARGALQTANVIWVTVSLPSLLIRGTIPLEAARPIGPVGIAQLTGGAVQQSLAAGWWFPVLQLMGLLSTALGMTNLLPLPALDGGRIFFIIIEAIRGRRISAEKEGTIHLIGFILLLAMMVVITYADITSPLPNVDWANLF